MKESCNLIGGQAQLAKANQELVVSDALFP